MKNIRLWVSAIVVLCTTAVVAQTTGATLTVGSIEGAAGKEVSVPLYLTNAEEVVAVQFDVELPYTLTSDIVLSENRKDGHIVNRKSIGANKYTVTVMSFSNNPIKGNSGLLMRLPMTVAAEAQADDTYPVYIADKLVFLLHIEVGCFCVGVDIFSGEKQLQLLSRLVICTSPLKAKLIPSLKNVVTGTPIVHIQLSILESHIAYTVLPIRKLDAVEEASRIIIDVDQFIVNEEDKELPFPGNENIHILLGNQLLLMDDMRCLILKGTYRVKFLIGHHRYSDEGDYNKN